MGVFLIVNPIMNQQGIGPRLTHIAAEIFDVNPELLDDTESMTNLVSLLVPKLGLTLVDLYIHKFDLGITIVAIITESHLAVHTWPEFGYAHIELLSCGPEVATQTLIDYVRNSSIGSAKIVGHDISGYSDNLPRLREGWPVPPPRLR